MIYGSKRASCHSHDGYYNSVIPHIFKSMLMAAQELLAMLIVFKVRASFAYISCIRIIGRIIFDLRYKDARS